MKNNIKAVIFDWAGTLIDFGCMAPAGVFVEVFKEYGVDLPLSIARQPMGLSKIDHLRALFSISEVESSWLDTHGAYPGEQMILDMYAMAEKRMTDVVLKYAVPVTGAQELMEQLRHNGIKIGSTTGYPSTIMQHLLKEPLLQEVLPDCVITPSDTPQGRPKPWMCFLNAQLLDVYPMHQMIKIGDTLADIEEGVNAGMWTVGLTLSGNEAGISKEEYEDLPVAVVEDIHGRIAPRMMAAGAHFTALGVWDCEMILEQINLKIGKGERP